MRRRKKLNGFSSAEVASVFRAYPAPIRSRLMRLRQLIFDTAAATRAVGAMQETLKWGQPSYVTAASGSGSTIRIDRVRSNDSRYAVYFHCQTTLIDTFRGMFGDTFTFEGNRCMVFDVNEKLPVAELRHCISLALTYHINRRSRARAPR